MEVGQKEQSKHETINIIIKGSAEQHSDFLRFAPAIERKLSKRREAQEERNVVLDLFKELIGKFNDGYSKVTLQNFKPSRTSKNKNKQKARREMPPREPKDNKPRKDSSEQIRVFSERKEEIWQNYAQLMNYQIFAEEVQTVQVVQLPQAQGIEAEQ